MEREIVFKKSGNRPDTGHFEAGERRAFPARIADELVAGRVAEYSRLAKKVQAEKAEKEI